MGKPNIVKEWYRVEYAYYHIDSPSITYSAGKDISNRKGAEEFIALLLFLAKNKHVDYNDKQKRLSNKLLGPAKAVRGLLHFYRLVKIEIEIVDSSKDRVKGPIEGPIYDEDLMG